MPRDRNSRKQGLYENRRNPILDNKSAGHPIFWRPFDKDRNPQGSFEGSLEAVLSGGRKGHPLLWKSREAEESDLGTHPVRQSIAKSKPRKFFKPSVASGLSPAVTIQDHIYTSPDKSPPRAPYYRDPVRLHTKLPPPKHSAPPRTSPQPRATRNIPFTDNRYKNPFNTISHDNSNYRDLERQASTVSSRMNHRDSMYHEASNRNQQDRNFQPVIEKRPSDYYSPIQDKVFTKNSYANDYPTRLPSQVRSRKTGDRSGTPWVYFKFQAYC